MKAIVFTMDAMFSLAITLAGVSVLLFFQFYSQAPYSIHYSNAQAILSAFASTPVVSIQNSSIIAKGIAVELLGPNETELQFLGGTQRNSSNGVGPLKPIFLLNYTPTNPITTYTIAGYNNVFFATGSKLYGIDIVRGKTLFSYDARTSIVSTPALYVGMVIFANTTNLTAVQERTKTVAWSTNAIKSITPITTPLTIYNDQVIFGTSSDNAVHAYYVTNGSAIWSYTPVSGAKVVSITVLGGTVITETSTGVVNTIVTVGSSAAPLIGTVYGAGNLPTNNIAGSGTRLYLGTGTYANSMYINETSAPGYPVATGSAVTGVALYKNYAIFQNSNTVIALSPSGQKYWSVSMPSSFGPAPANATPAVSSSMVYTVWANGIAGQNLTTGAVQWFALVPSGSLSPYMTLAYGRISVVENNALYVYGSCVASPIPQATYQVSLLGAATLMYQNRESGCANAMLNSFYPMTNYTFYVANSLTGIIAPTLTATQFVGTAGYINAHNTKSLNTTYVSATFWINISSLPASGVRLVNYGDNGSCVGPSAYCGWFFYLTQNGIIQFNTMNNGNQITANTPTPLSLNRWYMITGVDNGTSTSLYVNSNAPYTKSQSGAISPTSPNINLTIGTGRPCCDTRYFNGQLADLQIYRQPYGRQQVAHLYTAGAAAVPLSGFGLVAWYPLEGDANDYAGFNPGYITGNVNAVLENYTSKAIGNAYEITTASTYLSVINYSSQKINIVQAGVYSWS